MASPFVRLVWPVLGSEKTTVNSGRQSQSPPFNGWPVRADPSTQAANSSPCYFEQAIDHHSPAEWRSLSLLGCNCAQPNRACPAPALAPTTRNQRRLGGHGPRLPEREGFRLPTKRFPSSDRFCRFFLQLPPGRQPGPVRLGGNAKTGPPGTARPNRCPFSAPLPLGPGGGRNSGHASEAQGEPRQVTWRRNRKAGWAAHVARDLPAHGSAKPADGFGQRWAARNIKHCCDGRDCEVRGLERPGWLAAGAEQVWPAPGSASLTSSRMGPERARQARLDGGVSVRREIRALARAAAPAVKTRGSGFSSVS